MRKTVKLEEEDTAQTIIEPQKGTVQASIEPECLDLLKECRDCPRWEEVKERARVSVLLNKAINQYELKLNARGFKPTVAEYLKLLQLEREIEGDVMDEEMKVKWSEETAESQPEK